MSRYLISILKVILHSIYSLNKFGKPLYTSLALPGKDGEMGEMGGKKNISEKKKKL